MIQVEEDKEEDRDTDWVEQDGASSYVGMSHPFVAPAYDSGIVVEIESASYFGALVIFHDCAGNIWIDEEEEEEKALQMLCVCLFGTAHLPQGHDNKVQNGNDNGQEDGEEEGRVEAVIVGFALEVDGSEDIEVDHRNRGHEVNKRLRPLHLERDVKATDDLAVAWETRGSR